MSVWGHFADSDGNDRIDVDEWTTFVVRYGPTHECFDKVSSAHYPPRAGAVTEKAGRAGQ